jgi:hypothetical protein
MRLIRKRNIVDSIAAYDRQIKRMLLRDEYQTNDMRQIGASSSFGKFRTFQKLPPINEICSVCSKYFKTLLPHHFISFLLKKFATA